MLPSPSSSLSSFRDYYHHTSEATEESQEQLIQQGLINFKIAKVFTRLSWKVRQEMYWACSLAFSAIKAQHSRKGRRVAANRLFAHLLKKRAFKESKKGLQVEYLGALMDNVKEKRRK